MLGILSLITWALIVVVTLKYVVVVMRADNRGEGGVLALMALVSRQPAITPRRRRIYLMIGMLGAALFYGDCLLTPAISVLSAVEGLKVATPALQPVVLPIAIGVLVALFAVQHFGTAGVGRWFGPITLRLVHRAVRAGPQADRRGAAGAVGLPAASRLRLRPASRHRHLRSPWAR